MSESPLAFLSEVLGGGAADSISDQLGLDPGAVQNTVSMALPLLIGALQRNASAPGGAEAILGALNRDHDGSVLEDALGFLTGGGAEGAGQAILGHIFGGRQGAVQQQLGAASGLDMASVGRILAMLAPLVMGVLGRQTRDRGLDTGGLQDLLRGEEQRAVSSGSGIGDLLGGILDANNDGSMVDDVAKMGIGLLGKVLRGN